MAGRKNTTIIDLLLVSMRAHDESEGEFSTLGVIEQYDCKAWANWAT